MIIIKHSISYTVRENGSVRGKITWCGNTLFISTGVKITKKSVRGRTQWNGMRCLPGTLHTQRGTRAEDINIALEDFEHSVRDAFANFQTLKRIPSPAELRLAIRPKKDQCENIEKSYIKFMQEGARLHQWADNTLKSTRQVLQLVLKFDPHASLARIDREWVEKFIIYQQTHKLSTKVSKRGETGYSNAVIQKNCRVFSWFLKWAVKEELISPSILERITPTIKTARKPVIFLTWEELMRVYTCEPLSLMESNARDFFCFCAFTSLRYSDARTLRHEQIQNGAIHLTSQKTSTHLSIELNKYSRAILERYADLPEYALPPITLHHINAHLKKLGKRLGIDSPVTITQYYGTKRRDDIFPKYELLSSHCARRTFICNALSMGISPNVVMKWTGHTEYSSMRPYIDIADEIKASEMSKFDNFHK